MKTQEMTIVVLCFVCIFCMCAAVYEASLKDKVSLAFATTLAKTKMELVELNVIKYSSRSGEFIVTEPKYGKLLNILELKEIK